MKATTHGYVGPLQERVVALLKQALQETGNAPPARQILSGWRLARYDADDEAMALQWR